MMLPFLPAASLVFLSMTTRSLKRCSRHESAVIVDTHLLPQTQYGERTRLGGEIFREKYKGRAVRADDPLTCFTYGEFPLNSLDTLLDIASDHVVESKKEEEDGDTEPALRFLDLGSGCGRLCLYLALSRESWEVQGIEYIDTLHEEARRAGEVAVNKGWIVEDNPASPPVRTSTTLQLHHGLAEDFPSVLEQADIIFMYSTAMKSGPFMPAIQGLLLSRDWNELLTRHCRHGCVVVTTDRALDPEQGWVQLDRIDVPNPELYGSTGFIQRLSK